MNEFFNWHNSWILVQHNWIYLLVALAIGAYVGFTTSVTDKTKR
jgi:hypothetical protein